MTDDSPDHFSPASTHPRDMDHDQVMPDTSRGSLEVVGDDTKPCSAQIGLIVYTTLKIVSAKSAEYWFNFIIRAKCIATGEPKDASVPPAVHHVKLGAKALKDRQINTEGDAQMMLVGDALDFVYSTIKHNIGRLMVTEEEVASCVIYIDSQAVVEELMCHIDAGKLQQLPQRATGSAVTSTESARVITKIDKLSLYGVKLSMEVSREEDEEWKTARESVRTVCDDLQSKIKAAEKKMRVAENVAKMRKVKSGADDWKKRRENGKAEHRARNQEQQALAAQRKEQKKLAKVKRYQTRGVVAAAGTGLEQMVAEPMKVDADGVQKDKHGATGPKPGTMSRRRLNKEAKRQQAADEAEQRAHARTDIQLSSHIQQLQLSGQTYVQPDDRLSTLGYTSTAPPSGQDAQEEL